MKCPAIIKAGLAWAGRLWKRHGATIVLASGTTAVVAGNVLAVKAGTHVEETLEKHEIAKNKVEQDHDAGYLDEKKYREEIRKVKVETVKDFGKLFLPSGILTGSGIGLIFTSHGMMKKSLAVTAAAGIAIQKSFDSYRERVKDAIGEEQENDLYHGIESKEFLEEIQDKQGKTKTVKRVKKVYNGQSASPYVMIFDETNKYWKGREDYDFAFIKQVQCNLNDDLIIQKYVFWNEMLTRLGFRPRKIGQKIGCRLSKDGSTDNYIDFGIFEKNGTAKTWALREYREKHRIPIDFNLDGNILDKIEMEDLTL